MIDTKRMTHRFTLAVGIFCMLASLVSIPSWANSDGQKAFNANCQACHQADRMGVGPSMVYMKNTYPVENSKQFIAWALNPGKKNPDTIQMPAMSHLGTQTLTSIHEYILLTAKYLKERKPKPKYKPYTKPKPTYPNISRRYMPFTSPATIAVALTSEITLAWDTTIGKLRYVYPSNKNFFNGEKQRDKNKQDIIYHETANQLFSTDKDEVVDFKGYKIINGYPEFIYNVGDMSVKEKITRGKNNTSFVRIFTITGQHQPIKLNFKHVGKATFISNVGRWSGDYLSIPAHELTKFSIEVQL